MLLLAFFMALILPFEAASFELMQSELRLRSEGKLSGHMIELKNASRDKEAVKFEAYKRIIDIDGVENNTEPSSDITVFPKNLIIDAGSVASAHVQWGGKNDPEDEQSYRLIVTQMPVVLQNRKNKVLMQYSLPVFIDARSPHKKLNPKDALMVKSAKNVTIDGAKVLEIVIENVDKSSVKLTGFSFNVMLRGDEKRNFTISNIKIPKNRADIVLPKSTRRFYFDWPADVPFSAVVAEMIWD